MQLTHSFRIPVPVDEAWTVLRDIERVAPCMPGATIDSVTGDDFTGGVKVKVGPISMTYKGEASFVDVDEQHHRASIEARGRETRGSGTARATIKAELREVGSETEVTLVTDLAVTGKPAQFGRGVMADVGGKLVDQFAACLSTQLAGTGAAGAEPAPAATSAGVVGNGAAPVTMTDEAGAGAAPGTPETPAPLATPAMGAQGTQAAGPQERTGPAASAGETPPPPSTPPGPGPRPTSDTIDLLDVAGAPLAKRVGPLAAVVLALVVLRWLLGRRGRDAGPSRRQRRTAERGVKAVRALARQERKTAKVERRTARAVRKTLRSERRTAKAGRRTTRAEQRLVAALEDEPTAAVAAEA